jgi:hypothetical protein
MLFETSGTRSMDDQRFFADVNLPFHVWVREGRRWVLRDAAPRLKGESAGDAGGERGGEPKEPRGSR